eukprot:249292_1
MNHDYRNFKNPISEGLSEPLSSVLPDAGVNEEMQSSQTCGSVVKEEPIEALVFENVLCPGLPVLVSTIKFSPKSEPVKHFSNNPAISIPTIKHSPKSAPTTFMGALVFDVDLTPTIPTQIIDSDSEISEDAICDELFPPGDSKIFGIFGKSEVLSVKSEFSLPSDFSTSSTIKMENISQSSDPTYGSDPSYGPKHSSQRTCEECHQIFSARGFTRHMIAAHNGLLCTKCSQRFKSIGSLKHHKAVTCHSFQCRQCVDKFASKNLLNQHIRSVHAGVNNPVRFRPKSNRSKPDRPFKCPKCTATFGRSWHLKRHVRNEVCSKDPVSSCQRKSRIVGRLKCDQCSKTFTMPINLRRHVFHFHTPSSKTFECSFCGQMFWENYQRKLHLKRKHNVAVTIRHRSKPGTTGIHPCPVCKFRFTERESVRRHVLNFHPDHVGN